MGEKGEINNIVLKDAKHPFWLGGDKPINNLLELKSVLENVDDTSFFNHVDNDKHDFANWIRHSIEDHDLADKISHIKDKTKLINFLNSLSNSENLEEKDDAEIIHTDSDLPEQTSNKNDDLFAQLEDERNKLENLIPPKTEKTKSSSDNKNAIEQETEFSKNEIKPFEESLEAPFFENENEIPPPLENDFNEKLNLNNAFEEKSEPEMFISESKNNSTVVAEKNVGEKKVGFFAKIFGKKKNDEDKIVDNLTKPSLEEISLPPSDIGNFQNDNSNEFFESEMDIPKPEEFGLEKEETINEEIIPSPLEDAFSPIGNQPESQVFEIRENVSEEPVFPEMEKLELPSKEEFFQEKEEFNDTFEPIEDSTEKENIDDTQIIGSENIFGDDTNFKPLNIEGLEEPINNLEETNNSLNLGDNEISKELIDDKTEEGNNVKEFEPEEKSEEISISNEKNENEFMPNEELSIQKNDVDEKSSEIIELKEQINNNAKEIEKFSLEAKDKDEEIENLKEKIENLKIEKEEHKNLLVKTKEELEKKEEIFFNMESDYDNKKKELDEITKKKGDFDSIEEKRKELDELGKTLEKEKNGLSIKAELTKKNKEAYDNLKRKLDSEIRERETYLKELEKDFEKKNKFAEKKINELRNLELELEYKEKDLIEKEKILEQKRNELTDKEVSVNSKENRINELYEDHNKKQKELDQKEEELVKLIKDAELDKVDIEKEKRKFDESKQSFEEEIKKKKAEIENIKNDLDKREGSLNLKEKELNMADNALDYAMKEYSTKKEDLDDEEFHKYLHKKLNELSDHDEVMKTAAKKFDVNEKFMSEIQKIDNQIDSCRTLISKKDYASAKEIYNSIRGEYYNSTLNEVEKENIHNAIRDLYDEINLGLLNK